MSGRHSAVALFISITAISIVAFDAQDGMTGSRGPASSALPSAGKLLRHTEKLRGPLSVKLVVASGDTAKVGETFVMRGEISSRRPLESAAYSWTIPAGVEVINGTLDGTVEGIEIGETKTVEVTLRKLAATNLQIHLLASSFRAGMQFADSALYNTDVQELLDNNRKAMAKATAATVERQRQEKESVQPLPHGKIMH